MDEKRKQLLSEMPVVKAIFKLAIPVVMAMLIQLLYNLADVYFIGKLRNPQLLAAANLTTPLYVIMMALSGVIGTGAASFISRSLGANQAKKAEKTLSSGMAICIVSGAVLMLLGLVFINGIVSALGANVTTFAYTKQYTLILLLGTVPIMCNVALSQLLRSEGSVKVSMVGMMMGTLINLCLDVVFIFLLKMGITGAALSTVIGNAISVIYYLVFYLKGRSIVKWTLRESLPSKEILKEIFKVGIPASVSQMLMGIAVMVCNTIAVEYGDTFIAGLGIASKIMLTGTYIFMGFSAGSQPLIGYNYGAGNHIRLRAIIKSGMLITSFIGILLTVLFGLFAGQLISLFTPLQDVIKQGEFILQGLKWSLPVYGAYMIGSITTQATGKSRASLLLSVTRQGLFYIPILLLLHAGFGVRGLIYAQPVADFLALVLAVGTIAGILKNGVAYLKPAQAKCQG